ncbi:zinc finger CCCH domain-containing protein 2-like [Senna tora]|uniref:Zinc finger CCCH domain-containing protein 2-like n=1 Tax=Senna tora TaxID=362788 RepID=A0A834TKH5_9FABA|nr:zinc finger CCCH domain-containing protein 2-like [Senna tora]
MSSVCADQHKFLPFSSPKKSLMRDIDIPPRKLLTRRSSAADMYSDSPRFTSAEEAFLQKFLPHNMDSDEDDGDDEDSDPYSSDHFRMYEFKVRRCTRSRSHDWTDCPFAHPGEKARRRDPRRYHYSGTVCPEYRRGACSRGDSCEFAHGVFECWLHPARYRTEACKDGKNCKRKVCFFAHTPRQLRILPLNTTNSSSSADHHHHSLVSCKTTAAANKFLNNPASPGSNNTTNCCLFCHHCVSSPTSTLFGMSHMSPPLSPSSSAVSPPLSPVKRRSPISRYCDRFSGLSETTSSSSALMSYKDVLNELMSSLEGLNFIEAANSSSPVVSAAKPPNLPWLDVSLINSEDHHPNQQFIVSPTSSNFNCEDHHHQQQQHNNYHNQQQYMNSPNASSASGSCFSNNGKLLYNNSSSASNNNIYSNIESKVVSSDNGLSCSAPDLGWVNELLMNDVYETLFAYNVDMVMRGPSMY